MQPDTASSAVQNQGLPQNPQLPPRPQTPQAQHSLGQNQNIDPPSSEASDGPQQQYPASTHPDSSSSSATNTPTVSSTSNIASASAGVDPAHPHQMHAMPLSLSPATTTAPPTLAAMAPVASVDFTSSMGGSPNRNMAHRPAKTQTFPRPIRFVSNDGFPHAKRRRISAACLTCRKRKTRCSGEKPACDTCKQNGHECKGYREAPPRNVSTGTVTPGAGTSGYQSTATTPVTEHPHSHMFASPSGSHSGHDSQRHASMSSQSGTPGPPPMGNLLGLQSPGFPSNEGPKRKHDDEQLFAGSRRVSMADDGSPILQYQSPPNTQRLANRMPYFRYFGPTAIVPGYKQMVVEVRNPKPPGPASRSASSASSVTSPVSPYASLNSAVLKQPEASPAMTDEDLPLYDQNDPAPSHRLIGHLVETFFTHVGCNFPFLRRAAFMRDVEAKQVDAILVDAVCAVSARFSSDAMLVAKGGLRSAAGTQYANRAKSAMVETFACPNLAAVQACLLLAYAEFGGNRDSGLWMFLGCAIRMAQDLGLHKFMGDATAEHSEHPDSSPSHDAEELDTEERSNTFWAVYLLDRVISSGTGRPVALKDREIEIRMPAIDDAPFPALIRIIHLYGRVTDILNTSTSATSGDTMRRLGGMEADLTSLYSKLSPALHFNVANFQHFISTNQSSVFLLLHFWFHALIALLHRPTLFIGFEGRLRQLFPNSHELSMSSAKTIADIVAFAELLDLKALIGTPFNSQPIYIAACAFLQESAALSASSPSSSSTSHATSSSTTPSSSRPPTPTAMANHTLLAQAAQQNYQNCHKTLQAIEPYWAGVKYILTVMDQKAKGIVDPLLYTTEEMEAVEVHRWGPRVWSSWRRAAADPEPELEPDEPVGWSVAGVTGSPNSNLTFLYPPQQFAPPPTPALSAAGNYDADVLLALAPYTPGPSPDGVGAVAGLGQGAQSAGVGGHGGGQSGVGAHGVGAQHWPEMYPPAYAGGLMMESGDVDIGALGMDMGNWLGYVPGELWGAQGPQWSGGGRGGAEGE